MAENTWIKDMQANIAKLFEMMEMTVCEQKEHRAHTARAKEANRLWKVTFQIALEKFYADHLESTALSTSDHPRFKLIHWPNQSVSTPTISGTKCQNWLSKIWW